MKSRFLIGKSGAVALSLSILASAGSLLAAPVDSVDLFIGTGGHGHTYPGATVPFGAVQLSPDTPMKGWDGCSGYHYSDSMILGFSHTHLSGTGIGDLGDVMVIPVSGDLQNSDKYQPMTPERLGSPFSHTNEVATPGYYRVLLDKYQITAELTATPHAGMHRYTFPASQKGSLVIDLVHGVNNSVKDASMKIEGNMITGHRTTGGWNKERTVYYAIEASRPWSSFGIEAGGKLLPGDKETTNKTVRAFFTFDAASGNQVVLRVGISGTSVEGAKKNLKAEMASWDFDGIRAAARNTWNDQLSHVQIDTANPAIKQMFYTALYHSMTAPTLFNDADGAYYGIDRQVHTATNFQYYSTFSLWDAFRAEHPLLTLVQPQRVNDFVQTFLASYQQSPDKALPMWPLASFETWCMIGYHAAPVIWDAYAKGFRGFDAELAFQAMRDSAMGGAQTRGARELQYLAEYSKQGYVSAETGKRKSGAARTLEYSFDDWCTAQMAKALGKTNDYELFAKRSQNFTNVFDPAVGFFRGKTATGAWREPFDPKAVDFDDYVEASAWQYTFAVFHDVPQMINLYGGNEAFIRKLDELFDQDSDIHKHLVDVTGLVGHYAHGNEPCHHVAYLYALAGAQYKAAHRARQIMFMHYDNTPAGICGNDDCGQMSAWYVWNAMGLYPLNPASGIYVIGSPVVDKATIQLDPKFYKGKTFTLVAKNVSNQNIYVQSAKLNGEKLDRPWVTHEEIVNGGTLELEMGIIPNKTFGALK